MSSINVDTVSIVHWCPGIDKNKCGYCKNENSSISDGMWAEQLTVDDYQNLIDRGWRRSGKYCYKPIMNETCCPLYTIRCDAMKFEPSKSQKKIIKRVNKYLADGISGDGADNMSTNSNSDTNEESSPLEFITCDKPKNTVNFSMLENDIVESVELADQPSKSNITENLKTKNLEVKTTECKEEEMNETMSSIVKDQTTDEDTMITTEVKQGNGPMITTEVKKGNGPDPSRPACKKAKVLRLERKQQKLKEKGVIDEKKVFQNETKSFEELIQNMPKNPKYKLKIVLISTCNLDEDWHQNEQIEFELYKKYQIVIHNDPPEKIKLKNFLGFLVKTPLKLIMERISKFHPHFKTEAALFEKYQMAVHKEEKKDCGIKMFCEFLVDTPIKAVRMRRESGTIIFGSFHQQYWLNDKLIAVGVIDILPKCISSVYFFYDPDYRFLTLGTYGSLREIFFIRCLHRIYSSIEHYYMGYYVHSCPKMRYKARLGNSSLMCPETYKWFPIEKCIPKFENNKYVRLNDDENDVDEEACSPSDIDQIKILLGSTFIYLKRFKEMNGGGDCYQNVGRHLGKKCALKILFIEGEY